MRTDSFVEEFAVRPNSDCEIQEIAHILKEARLKHGLSVRQVAELMGFGSVQAIYKHENGTAVPTGEVLWAYMKLYGINPLDGSIRNSSRNNRS